jgi:hypothetical protein
LEPAKVITHHNELSFNVQTPDGVVYRRNCRFLNKAPELSDLSRQTQQPSKEIEA